MFNSNRLWAFDNDKKLLEFANSTDIIDHYRDLWKQVFPGINLDPHTPQGQLIANDVNTDLLTISFLNDLANYFMYGGEGRLLDVWAWNNYRTKRRPQTNGTVTMTIEGKPFENVEPDFIVTNGDINFEPIEPFFIPQEGKVKVVFRTTEFTKAVAPAGSITRLVTPNLAINKWYNESASSPGIEAESDSVFYLRCLEYGSVFKNTSFRSILSNLAAVPGVIKINGYENPTTQAVNYRGVNVPAHGIALVIFGGSDADIGDTLTQTKPPGCAMAGDVEIPVNYEGHTIKYKILRPQAVELKCELSVSIELGAPSNYEDILKTHLINYINDIKLGAQITLPALACAVAHKVKGVTISDIKLGLKSGTADHKPIDLEFKQMATLAPEDITIAKN